MDVFSVENGCYQEPGMCDPDRELPCRCPRRDNVDPPDSLPMAATAENRERLEEWIKEYYIHVPHLVGKCKLMEYRKITHVNFTGSKYTGF